MSIIYKYLIVFFLLFTFSHAIYAQQFSSGQWHNGFVVLESSTDTLEGVIKYNLDENFIQINQKGNIKVFSARKVLFFKIYDNFLEQERYFFSLPYALKYDYETPIFFEVLHEGKLTLLCREFITQEPLTYGSLYGAGLGTGFVNRLNYYYYFLKIPGSIEKYTPKKKNLLKIMKDREKEVSSFMKTNKLNYDQRNHLVQITAYYNRLSKN